MGLYAGLMKEDQKRNYSDRELFVRYIRRIAPFKKSVIRITLFIVISAGADILNPLLLSYIVDEFIKIEPNYLFIFGASFIYLLLYGIIWLMFYLNIKR